jgi:hypothetical protein
LHSGNDRKGRPAEIADELVGLALAGALAIRLSAEISEIVPRRKAIAISLE